MVPELSNVTFRLINLLVLRVLAYVLYQWKPSSG
jgi:hypothetical protein